MVLEGLDLWVHPGEAVAIVGPSGSGKSTLLNIVGSLENADSGSVKLGDTLVTGLTRKALEKYRSQTVGFVFQEHLLLPYLNALDNVLLPGLGRREPALADRARYLLERIGMGERLFDFPSTLSGGERQRVALARALIHEPSLILADEPTGSLDHDRAVEDVDLLVSEAREQRRMVLMVTHNLALAARFDRTLSLQAGVLEPH